MHLASTPILETRDLSIGYTVTKKQVTTIQKEVNIQLHSGNITSLLGINGIGKTSLLRTLAGIQNKLSGEIFINQMPLEKFSPSLLSTLISVVLTDKISTPSLTVLETIKIGRTPFLKWSGVLTEEDQYWINKAIYYTDIEELLDRHLSQLSDGQLQRVMIARAITQNTPIILLDEPSNHLDLHHKVHLLKMLKKLAKKENKAILYSSHDIDLSLELSDSIITLKTNSAIQGTPDELIKKEVFKDFFLSDHVHFSKEEKRFVLTP